MRRAIPFLLVALLITMAMLCERPHECPECESGSEPVTSLRVLTYNVLADRELADVRLPALLGILEKTDAHILAFQEAAPWFLERLLAEPWVRDRYQGTPLQEGYRAPGGVFILSRFPQHASAVHRLSGRQGRAVLLAELHVGDRHVLVATAHLESFLQDGAIRAGQLGRVFGLIGEAQEVIFLGDFNFGDGEQPETRALDERFVDAWKQVRSGDPGFTWDIEKNDLAQAGSFHGEPSRRLDRVLVRSKTWKPKAARILGDEAVDEDGFVFPSDHFGLVAELTR